jgi:hypothetical protein
MKFTVYQESRQGGRGNNEDRTAYSYTRDSLLLVIADGMGGHHHGEIAAQIAAQTLVNGFQREAKPQLPDPFLFLQRAINHGHRAILDYTAQKHFIDQICSIARDTGMHVHLVAHSKKKADEFSPPGKMDVKGSGSITDQVDNVITVWRNKKKEQEAEQGRFTSDPDALMICDKQRNGEWEGKVALWFNKESFAFHESERF